MLIPTFVKRYYYTTIKAKPKNIAKKVALCEKEVTESVKKDYSSFNITFEKLQRVGFRTYLLVWKIEGRKVF